LTEDGGGEKEGGSKRTLASEYGDATKDLGGSENFFVFLLKWDL
jgi:hypothetical protein